VPFGGWVSYRWKTKGGSGVVDGYQYKLEPRDADWRAESMEQSARFEDLTEGDYTFSVRATDSGGNTDEESRTFSVDAEVLTGPVAEITAGPEEDLTITFGRPVTFEWSGEDQSENFGRVVAYTYKMDDGAWADWTLDNSVTYDDLAVGDHTFYVKSKDNQDLESDEVSRSFTVAAATILWIDDYYFGDPVSEFAEWNFMDLLFYGYAWDEYDTQINDGLGPPDLTGYTTAVWTTTDGMYSDGLIDWIDGGDRTWLTDWLDAGGNLLIDGGAAPVWIQNPHAHDPQAGDFSYDYLGWDTDANWGLDLGHLTYYTTWCTFVHGVTALGYPAEMKVDVGKDGSQHREGHAFPYMQTGTQVIFTGGLDVDGDEPEIYEETVGYIYTPAVGDFMTAMLGFPTWYFAGGKMQTTYQNILTEFGE
jgi:hypothetical protein